MKRCAMQVLIAGFMLASVSTAACSPKAPYSDLDVLDAFNSIAEAQTLPDRRDIHLCWSCQIVMGEVTYIEEAIFEVKFPDMQLSGVEVWIIDMETSQIWPYDSGALLSAIALFCKDANDKTGDCESYFRLAERLKEILDS